MCENHVYLYFILRVIFHPIFFMQLLFYMFSTLMSLEDRWRLKVDVKTEISLYMAVMLHGPPMAIPIYTVLLYCAVAQDVSILDIWPVRWTSCYLSKKTGC